MTIIVDTGQQRVFTSANFNAPLNPPPGPDWVDVAVSHYMHAFVVKSRDGIGGIYEFMPVTYALSSHESCIRPALQAVAMVNLARVKCMSGKHWYRAQRLYGDALRALKLALNDTGEAHSKTTLLATVLLSEFDVMTGKATTPISSPHHKGTMLILRSRFSSGLEKSCQITQGTSLRLLLDSLGQDTPDLPLFSPHLGAPSPTILNSMFRLALLLYRVVSLRYTMPAKSAPLEAREAHAKSLWELHEDLRDWEFSALGSERWQPDKQILPRNTVNVDRGGDAPRMISKFPSLNAILIWTSLWNMRLEVLLCLHGLQPAFEVQLNFSALGSSICSAVYQSTGQAISGMSVEKPAAGVAMTSLCIQRSLRIAIQVPTLARRRRLWIERQLDLIARSKGI